MIFICVVLCVDEMKFRMHKHNIMEAGPKKKKNNFM